LEEKFLPLESFIQRMRYQLMVYRKNPVSYKLDQDKYNRLMDLGLEVPRRRNTREQYGAADQEWNDRFALLQEYKAKYKSCIFSHSKEKLQNLEEKFLPLKNFIIRMKYQSVLYRKNPASSMLDEDNYNQLYDLGLEVPRRMMTKEKYDTPDDQKWNDGFALLQEYASNDGRKGIRAKVGGGNHRSRGGRTNGKAERRHRENDI
jgi:hypothetical protein